MPVRCPFCGTEEERECQTKEFGREYRHWRIGDYVWLKHPDGAIYCHTHCPQPQCAGHDRRFYVKVELVNGVITGEHTVSEEDFPDEEE